MAATGTESVTLSQLRTWGVAVDGEIEKKVDEPATSPTAGQVLSYDGTKNVWTAPTVAGSNVTGTVGIANGGTGASTAMGANYAILSDLTVSESAFRDDTPILYLSGDASAETGAVYTKSGSNMWSYIKDKADDTYIAEPTGGTAGQVLTKTADGAEWADAQGGDAYVLPLASASALGGIKGEPFAATGGNDPYAEVQIYNATEKAVVGAASSSDYGVVKFATDEDFKAYMGLS